MDGASLLMKFELCGIYGRVVLDGKGFFTNDPPRHPDRVGLPVGHPPLESFLGVPLIHEGRTIGTDRPGQPSRAATPLQSKMASKRRRL